MFVVVLYGWILWGGCNLPTSTSNFK